VFAKRRIPGTTTQILSVSAVYARMVIFGRGRDCKIHGASPKQHLGDKREGAHLFIISRAVASGSRSGLHLFDAELPGRAHRVGDRVRPPQGFPQGRNAMTNLPTSWLAS
jgi:hypothetical protein